MKKHIYEFVSKGCQGALRSMGRRVLPVVLCGAAVSATAIDKQTVATLTDQNLVLSGAIELHITSATTPFLNSTVSLNHEDAWVFFDNIRPSVVLGTYMSNILVNGSPAVSGTNARVAIYAHGTVVMPHSPSYAPLTVYKEEGFGGESTSYGLHTYFNSLGSFDNAVKSFKLKRGYMATLATAADGSGYSRVFVADEADLEFNVAPDLLKGTVSFIRVFKHQWVTKKGWCGTGSGGYTDGDRVNGTWFYSWSADQFTTSNLEYAVIKQNAGWPGWGEINGKQHVSHLLGYNEPDRPDQSNLTFDYVMGQWPEYMKSGLRIGSPATSDPFNSWSTFNFVDKCKTNGYRLDFVAIHAYWNKSVTQWYNDLKNIHDRTGRGIWITEWNNGANWTSHSFPDSPTLITDANATKQLNDLKAILNVLDTCHFVERYSIYNWVQDARAMVLTIDSSFMARNTNYANYNWLKTAPVVGTRSGKLLDGTTGTVNIVLTPAGQYYAANKSRMAFQRVNEVIPTYTYKSPVLEDKGVVSISSTQMQFKMAWTDSNGELSRMHRLERKINNGAYETIYESSNTSVLAYADNIVAANTGKVTYRLSLLTGMGTYLSSNEISYYQGSGADNIQSGELVVNNSNWAWCTFSQRFSSNPMVILGITSQNNGIAMSSRVSAVGTRYFSFHVDPWLYLNNPTLSNSDKLSFVALPAGTYDFGGLKGQAAAVTSVNGEWKSVTFPTAFAAPPAVFCTQTTVASAFPAAIAVRNVTATGFELRLTKEEGNVQTFIGDIVHYLAVETGAGAMAGRRIMVGKTAENAVGSSFNAATVDIDPSFTQPAVFAGMLSANDNITSTLRYVNSSATKASIYKQREISVSITNMAKDQIGWMVMDLAPNQVVTSVNPAGANTLVVYPNPAKDVLYLNLAKPTRVTVVDMFGRKQLDVEASHSFDVSMLPFGTYLLTVKGYATVRFVKK